MCRDELKRSEKIMGYEEFKKKQDIELGKRRYEMLKRANREYNKGLAGGLGFIAMHLYPSLKRSDT